MNLRIAEEGRVYRVVGLRTGDSELDAFLFSLGLYSGEPVTVIARRRGSRTLAIKDGRYNVDELLAEAILVE